LEQIAKAITQMEQVTQQTAASAEESASAAEELTAQSESVKDILGRLTAMLGGGESDGMRRPETSHVQLARLTSHRGPALAASVATAHKSPFPMDEDL
jgi:methyl-accepting chemotaxis protein